MYEFEQPEHALFGFIAGTVRTITSRGEASATDAGKPGLREPAVAAADSGGYLLRSVEFAKGIGSIRASRGSVKLSKAFQSLCNGGDGVCMICLSLGISGPLNSWVGSCTGQWNALLQRQNCLRLMGIELGAVVYSRSS